MDVGHNFNTEEKPFPLQKARSDDLSHGTKKNKETNPARSDNWSKPPIKKASSYDSSTLESKIRDQKKN